MGVATGCGCKEVYRLPHTTYPWSFLQQHPYFLFIKKMFFFLYIIVLLSSRHNVIIYLHNILYSLHRPFTVLLDYTRKCYSVDE